MATTIALTAILTTQTGGPLAYANAAQGGQDAGTTTPIKHLIVLIGENRTFDHTFATYQPKNGRSVGNLLSRGIITDNGAPGPNSALATQNRVPRPLPSTYFISATNKTPYSPLPTPQLNGAPNQPMPLGSTAPFDLTVSDAELQALEPSLEPSAPGLLRTGATGAAGTTGLDSRVTSATGLPNTVFQLTGPTLPYDSYTGDTVHRFWHMWTATSPMRHPPTRRVPQRLVSIRRTGAG